MGLFRENRDGGPETGYSVASEDPQTRIRIALQAAFGHGKTIDGAASAGVDDVATLRH